ncbi:MAG: segregation/condensation protein A [Firmicutes bacterium]|nr:segregation/condensation protein A [Bacillota bacterium]MCL2256316.1 segregation/condensation protein A [Bacillota bacterium]
MDKESKNDIEVEEVRLETFKGVVSEEEAKKLQRLHDYIEKLKNEGEYEAHEIKLDQFDGPIDLLLHLVKVEKIKIEDIFMSNITEQYLSYMEQTNDLDLEKASEFIIVATQLIEIKSRSLLPSEKDIEETNSAKRELIQKIEEYRILKEAFEEIKEKETIGAYYKESDFSQLGDPDVILKDMNKEGLMNALKKLFLKLEKKALLVTERKIQLDRFTVSDKIEQIKQIMVEKDKIKFSELFDTDHTKSEIINTFLALLELLKLQVIMVTQDDAFQEIAIKRHEGDGESLDIE